MKLRTLTIGTLTACMLAGLAGPAVAAPMTANGNEAPILIGHRGAAGIAPENTLAAFKAGSQAGVDFVELDVQLSRDGVPFIFHDETPARTTNVEKVFPGRANDPITSFTWKELRRLDAGSYFAAKYAGERIPHFDEVAGVLTGKHRRVHRDQVPGQVPGRGKGRCRRVGQGCQMEQAGTGGEDRGPRLRRRLQQEICRTGPARPAATADRQSSRRRGPGRLCDLRRFPGHRLPRAGCRGGRPRQGRRPGPGRLHRELHRLRWTRRWRWVSSASPAIFRSR